MKKYIYVIIILFVSITTSLLVSQSFRVGQIPNGGINSCANCHVSAFGGGPRNSFGQRIEQSFLNSQGNVVWNSQLANLDSDGDGFSNGVELQNPTGIWNGGPVGDPSKVTNPGDPNSKPNPTSVTEEIVPQQYRLLNNYPNPFNPSTTITFEIPKSEFVSLQIFNINGELIKTILQESLNAGRYEKRWNGEDDFGNQVVSGVYFYRIKAGHFEKSSRMILLK
ncbi:MAG: T9SS type A sorting domain-containing protein [Ignavibacteria bacterium]|nr:T9SS type A sorting domain-containing protein [Ignavibacteria bacterium]